MGNTLIPFPQKKAIFMNKRFSNNIIYKRNFKNKDSIMNKKNIEIKFV